MNRFFSEFISFPMLPGMFLLVGCIQFLAHRTLPPLFLIIFSATWIYCGYLISFKRFCTLTVVEKHHLPPFWVRKKDEIILAIIAAALGALFGIVGTLLIRN